ncbi:predicted Na(+)-dicarboxylate cotransporter (solute carrier family 13 protein) [Desulforapulum autotrophicum HRM2]|uniref:Predicted Na(+)-dicarboxylate cotransporter (Solute carrier family 13 protein) n=1 Tax=Desulforapulum autotrophicum (strain ATCC 43914 / DSM 3382 / VKM B-1955 / HRM2) TaxID=177437 RepID=C0QJP0_DESAH|nr:SLC13 family permease [Desulforapulum autotrophicum]ACN13893.1 predicted Na(+)-dicarboxylate cotransporter (solute carrier family 13 protein) [Desulforapulum autotrophicum HRM2]
MKFSKHTRSKAQMVGLIFGPVLFFLVLSFDFVPGKPVVTRMAAIALLMSIWWITEAIPLAGTAILPMILYPLMGILAGKATAPIYFNSTIFLFIGGFMIALTMEKWDLHRRLALLTIRTIGGGPSRIILGFMAASAFLSAWMSNTATTIMMLPIGLSIILKMEEEFGEADTHCFALCLMLGIAYAASMGGMATLVGTPPNLVLQRTFQLTFPEAPPISFGIWMIMAVPISVCMVLTIWVVLTKLIYRPAEHLKVDPKIVNDEYKALGPMSYEEKVVAMVFFITALLWVFRKNLVLGFMTIPGWSNLLPTAKLIDDGTVAIFMAFLLFFFPTRNPQAKTATLMDVTVFKNLPWDIVILFGGGFALAKGFQVTGLADFIGNKLQVLAGFSTVAMIGVICTSLTFLTELTSNTATTQMILPILASIAVAMKTNPLLLMIPAALASSCAFMMPVATPPNAIVFGSGRVKIGEMVKAGLLINLIGIVLITTLFLLVGTAVFGIKVGVLPVWAQ